MNQDVSAATRGTLAMVCQRYAYDKYKSSDPPPDSILIGLRTFVSAFIAILNDFFSARCEVNEFFPRASDYKEDFQKTNT